MVTVTVMATVTEGVRNRFAERRKVVGYCICTLVGMYNRTLVDGDFFLFVGSQYGKGTREKRKKEKKE